MLYANLALSGCSSAQMVSTSDVTGYRFELVRKCFHAVRRFDRQAQVYLNAHAATHARKRLAPQWGYERHEGFN